MMTNHANTTVEVGSQIAPHLKLAAVLGEGGMATVFEAHHTRLNASVAVKVLTLTGDNAKQAGWRLVREARICARIEDAHIPCIYDVAELPDGRPYVVMEKVTGPTLEQYMLQGTPTIASVIKVARELLLALKAAHQAGVVHRDVKPGNVILQRVNGQVQGVRLMDFGIAHVRADEGDPSTMTSPGMLVGTPGYMAPEQVHADCVDPRADLYSLGVVIYEMLTGTLPFTNPDSIARLRATVDENVPDVRKVRSDCPAPLAEVVARATRRTRGERYWNAEEMLAALNACEQELVRRPTPARSGVFRKMALMGLGASAVTALWWAEVPADLLIPHANADGMGEVSPDPAMQHPADTREALSEPAASARPSTPVRTSTEAPLSLPAQGAGDEGQTSAAAGGALEEPPDRREESELLVSREYEDVEPSARADESPALALDARAVPDEPPPARARRDMRARDESALMFRPSEEGILVSDYLRKLDAVQKMLPARDPEARQTPGEAALGDLPDNPYASP